MIIRKKQIKKALSRGLRGKTNNVPGLYGRIFYKIGLDASKDVCCADYCRFHRFDPLDEYAIAIEHKDTYFVIDLLAFFYCSSFAKEHLL